jgi:hypothetical protein
MYVSGNGVGVGVGLGVGVGDGVGVGVSGLTLEKRGPGHPERKRDVVKANNTIGKRGQRGRMDLELL